MQGATNTRWRAPARVAQTLKSVAGVDSSNYVATASATRAPAGDPKGRGAVLLVDDDPCVLSAFRRQLGAQGHRIVCAEDGALVPQLIRSQPFDAIVTDIAMAGLDGFGVLRAVHEHDPDLPVVLVTGGASLDAAIRALDLGAHRFLLKPLDRDVLSGAVRAAIAHRREALAARRARELAAEMDRSAAVRASLFDDFTLAIGGLWMAFQPIVRHSDRGLFGYEALVRSAHAPMAGPGEIIQAAEQLGRLGELGRAIHGRVAQAARGAPEDAAIFVNLHPWDLRDEGLLAPSSPLAGIADRVVLEITERASLEHVPDLRPRIDALRRQGFRIAVDDLGAGYAGLSWVADLAPDVVKVDMSLIRGVDRDPTRQRLVRAIAELCTELRIRTVAEGVETPAERDALSAIGCDLMQGFLFARPAAAFARPVF
jgi:EAL domain-containing protein (putative c-di-GMP-specific phosphodiesterase class I)